jgi:hypothetical protein
MNYAVINSQTNVVENTIVWDGVAPWTPPDGCYVELIGDSGAGIGWTFANNEWITPAPQPETL